MEVEYNAVQYMNRRMECAVHNSSIRRTETPVLVRKA